MKRVLEFVRSVIPEDPFQLFFLGGIACLIAAHGLRWQPARLPAVGQFTGELGLWLQFGAVFFIYFIVFSAMAGYFVCFWPGDHPARRVVCLVFIPGLLGLGLMFARVLYFISQPASILESASSAFGRNLHLTGATLWKLSPGFHVTIIGLLLIAIFISRMALGIARFPVTLRNAHVSAENSETWRRLQMVVFMLVGPLFLSDVLVSFVCLEVPWITSSRPYAFIGTAWYTRFYPSMGSVVACSVLLWVMGRENRQTIFLSIRRPDRTSFLLALAFPAGTFGLISVVQFLFDHAQWAAHDIGRLASPDLAEYFSFSDPWLFLLCAG